MKKAVLSAIAFSVLMLTSCATNSGKDSGAGDGLSFAHTPTGTATSVLSASHASFSYADVNGKAYAVYDNIWGIPSNGKKGICEIFEERLDSTASFGWSWNGVHGQDVLMYPSVCYGRSPYGAPSWGSPSAMPARIDSLSGKKLTANIDAVSRHSENGIWDLAFDIWITSGSNATTPNGSYEIMIWLDRNRQRPSGSLMATPFAYNGSSGLRDFQVWATKHNEISSDSNHWTCVSYINSLAQDNPDSTFYTDPAFDLSAFINDAVARFSGDGLNGSWTITSIEFGNEVVDGTGITEIKNWSITVN